MIFHVDQIGGLDRKWHLIVKDRVGYSFIQCIYKSDDGRYNFIVQKYRMVNFESNKIKGVMQLFLAFNCPWMYIYKKFQILVKHCKFPVQRAWNIFLNCCGNSQRLLVKESVVKCTLIIVCRSLSVEHVPWNTLIFVCCMPLAMIDACFDTVLPFLVLFTCRWIWCLYYCVLRQRYPGIVHWRDCRRSDRLWVLRNHTHSVLFTARRWCTGSGT